MADHAGTESEPKRRKVRKGTHSCWECRRRKIRCQFDSENDAACLPCQARGSPCRGQEYADTPRLAQQQDRGVAQRLSRLEDLMAKLVDRIIPGEVPGASSLSSQSWNSSPAPSEITLEASASAPGPIDALMSAAAEESPLQAALGVHGRATRNRQPHTTLTPQSEPTREEASPRNAAPKYEDVCRTLYPLFPRQQDVTAIVQATTVPFFVTSLFSSYLDTTLGKSEAPDSVSIIPPETSHTKVLRLRKPLKEQMLHIIATLSRLVTSDDDLVGTAEGLQSLVLLGYWHSNAGNLRKAWLSFRRAMSLGQLMGIDQGSSRSLQFVDPGLSTARRPTPQGLWYRINSCDRSLSLMLGLPVGSTDDSFAAENSMEQDTPMERLAKLHAVISKRIIERNTNKSAPVDIVTQIIDGDLERAHAFMGHKWWTMSSLGPSDASQVEVEQQMTRMVLQIQHFDLRIILHLPNMLRSPQDNRHDDSRSACAQSSREVLRRFLSFREQYSSAWACRHIDYSALVAAMTLLLSYLGQPTSRHNTQPDEDRKLIEVVRGRMQHVALLNHDRLSQESADTIGRMLPVLDMRDASQCLHFDVPHLGTVNIHPSFKSLPSSIHAEESCDPLAHDASTHFGTSASLSVKPMCMDFDTTKPLSPRSAATWAHQDSYLYIDTHLQDEAADVQVAADGDDWVFQGVESSYWSLLNLNTL
ncbi:transcription factor sdnS [Parachaetomium inaequale]|uniref:Transcription factor sdnS n=1 Tax=Parachaetomium inaequale TaxID=2588326 RepID=A0AAN6P4L4_9PEZI|nr:transcription factor sdnS [Parachaetomium inaequale]